MPSNGARNADVTLSVALELNPDISKIVEDITSTVSSIEGKIPKIQLQIDKTLINDQISEIKSKLDNVSKTTYQIKISDNFGKVFKDLTSAITKSTENLTALNNALAGVGKKANFSNLEQSSTSASNSIEAVRSELRSLETELKSFSGINIQIGGSNSVKNNRAFGVAARAAVAELKEQVEQIYSAFREFYNMSDNSVNASINAVMRASYESNSPARADISKLLFTARDDPKVVSSLTGQMEVAQQFIKKLQEVASARGIDLTPVTSKFRASADQIVADAQRVGSSGEQIEQGVEGLKAAFSSLTPDLTPLLDQLTKTESTIEGIAKSLADLGGASIQQFIETINNATAAITKLTEVMSAVGKVEISADTSGLQTLADTQEQIQETANTAGTESGVVKSLEAEQQRVEQIKNEEVQKVKAANKEIIGYEGSEITQRHISHSTDQNGNPQDRVRSTHTENAIDERGRRVQHTLYYDDNVEKLTSETYNFQTDAENAKEASKALTTYQNALEKLNKERQKYASLQNDESDSVRKAYAALDELETKTTEAYAAYQNPGHDIDAFNRSMEQINRDYGKVDSTLSQRKEELSALQKVESDYLAKHKQLNAALLQNDMFSGQEGSLGDTYAALQAQNTALEEAKVALDEGRISREQYNAVSQETAQLLATSSEAFAKEKNEIKKQAENEKLRTQATREANRALDEGREALEKYTAAKYSSNKSSQDAYNTIQTEINNLENLKTARENNTISDQDYAKSVRESTANIEKSTDAIKQNGDAHQTLAQRIGNATAKFGSWLSITQVIMSVIRSLKQMVKAAIEVDDAMTQMQIVTRATDTEMGQFAATAADAAQKVGSSITDFVDSATTFARLGYSMDESSQLAQFTGMLQNVGKDVA